MSRLGEAFRDPDPSVRLTATLSAGIEASQDDLEVLIKRCAVEPDFQVREMLTWALIRLPREIVAPRLVAELANPAGQARQQALHTLSKIKDESTWPVVAARLDDPDENVVRTAWYASVAVAPESERAWLAGKLADRLGHGDRETQLSLSRALVALGPEIVAPLLASAKGGDAMRRHVQATQKLLEDPEAGFDLSREAAHHEVAMGRTRSTKG